MRRVETTSTFGHEASAWLWHYCQLEGEWIRRIPGVRMRCSRLLVWIMLNPPPDAADFGMVGECVLSIQRRTEAIVLRHSRPQRWQRPAGCTLLTPEIR